MSAADPAAAAAFKAAVHQLEAAIPGLNATKYLSVAGFVILLYDHLLLFGDETRVIWPARWSWSKALFLFNRYSVPLCLIVTTHQISGISAAGLSDTFCKTWLSMVTFMCAITLAIANVFVVQRVYALWGRSRRILMVLTPIFTLVYISTIVSAAFAVIAMLPHVTYSPFVKTCIIDERPILFIAAYAVPICFDIFLFSLTCWNAFDRPRHMQTAIVKQLYRDGVVYFVALLSLRLFNILIVSLAPIAYVQFGVYFIWSMITALINRMLITISRTVTVRNHESNDPSSLLTPNEPLQSPPFELSEMMSMDEVDSSFMDLSFDPKSHTAPQLPMPVPMRVTFSNS